MSERGPALWQLGFRPFYLLAALFAALSVGLWAAQFAGYLPYAYHTGPEWHAHEMLFGYALAVIAGFLLTAVPNWTRKPTPVGAPLAALAALWVAARVLLLTPWSVAAAIANIAFPLGVAVGIGIPLWQARNKRNYFFVGLMVLMAVALAMIHLAELDVLELPTWAGVQLGLDVVLIVISVMAGRVVPMFTNNAVPGAHARRSQNIERASLGGVVVLLVADLVQLTGTAMIVLCLALAIAHAWRLALWNFRATLRAPLLWVLHVSYGWLPVHFALRAAYEAGWVARPLAIHALTIGAIGGLTMGMMIRTARGHTGRPLKADGYEITCFVLMIAAAVVRVFWPIIQPQYYLHSVECSGLLWFMAFVLYLVRHWPILTGPRLGGQPG
jgi:uncharacterized protein involved in response to NO